MSQVSPPHAPAVPVRDRRAAARAAVFPPGEAREGPDRPLTTAHRVVDRAQLPEGATLSAEDVTRLELLGVQGTPAALRSAGWLFAGPTAVAVAATATLLALQLAGHPFLGPLLPLLVLGTPIVGVWQCPRWRAERRVQGATTVLMLPAHALDTGWKEAWYSHLDPETAIAVRLLRLRLCLDGAGPWVTDRSRWHNAPKAGRPRVRRELQDVVVFAARLQQLRERVDRLGRQVDSDGGRLQVDQQRLTLFDGVAALTVRALPLIDFLEDVRHNRLTRAADELVGVAAQAALDARLEEAEQLALRINTETALVSLGAGQLAGAATAPATG